MYIRVRFFFIAALSIAPERASNGVEHLLVAKWLGKEVDCSGLHGPDRHRNVAMGRNEDDRYHNARGAKFRLQIEAAQARQPNVQDEATRDVG